MNWESLPLRFLKGVYDLKDDFKEKDGILYGTCSLCFDNVLFLFMKNSFVNMVGLKKQNCFVLMNVWQ